MNGLKSGRGKIILLTAKASWYSKTLMSDIFSPDFSKTLGVA